MGTKMKGYENDCQRRAKDTQKLLFNLAAEQDTASLKLQSTHDADADIDVDVDVERMQMTSVVAKESWVVRHYGS